MHLIGVRSLLLLGWSLCPLLDRAWVIAHITVVDPPLSTKKGKRGMAYKGGDAGWEVLPWQRYKKGRQQGKAKEFGQGSGVPAGEVWT